MSDYYDIDDLLTEAELVPVIFTTAAADLGYLDEQNLHESDLAEESRVELPWFLASQLATRDFVKLDLPKVLQPTFRDMILADPTVVDLAKQQPFFFEFGIKYASIVGEREIGHTLCRVMNTRFKEIVRRTANRKQSESVEYMNKLSNMEKKMYECKAAGLLQYHKLANRSSIQLGISPVLASLPSYHPSQTNKSSSSASATNNQPLRNITNNAAQTQSSNQAQAGGSASTNAAHSASARATAAGTKASQSTLAQLTAINSANLPLATHERRRFGQAAIQARLVEQERIATQRAVNSATQQQQQSSSSAASASAARKRRLPQNQ